MIEATAIQIEDFTLNISEEIHVNAPIEMTFEALLEQVGPLNEVGPERPLPLKLEPWPGGRWYRDLADGNGHFWGHVQAINRPTLLEFYGPLIMSYPVRCNVQYRLSEERGGTLIKFRHLAFGTILPEHREIGRGWTHTHEAMKKRLEARKSSG
jgi:uncharacterized protein YndB with AHSA1/START domain